MYFNISICKVKALLRRKRVIRLDLGVLTTI